MTQIISKTKLPIAIPAIIALLLATFYPMHLSSAPPTRDQAKAYLVQLRKELQLPASEQVVFDQVYDGGCGPDQTSWLHNRIVCIYNLAYYVKGEEKSPEGFENATKDIQTLQDKLTQLGWRGVSGSTADTTSHFQYFLYSDVVSPANNPLTLHLDYFKASDPIYKNQDVDTHLGLGTHLNLKNNEYIYGIGVAVAYRQNVLY